METGTGTALKSSGPGRISKVIVLWTIFGLALGIGNLTLHAGLAGSVMFVLSFILGAALPTLAVVALASSRLGQENWWKSTWPMLVSDGTISIVAAILLDGVLPFLAYSLLSPLGFFSRGFTAIQAGSYDLFERILFSPMVVVFLLFVAIQAPIPEEIAKAFGPAVAMKRVKNEGQAFLLGLASGAGFAIIENMLYEGLYIQWSGWSWGGITLLRGIGSILHPLCTGIIALALYRARQPGVRWLAIVGPAYLLSVGLHTLWNGGFQALVYLTGLDSYLGKGPSFSLYGTSVQVVLVLYLAALAGWLWLRFYKILQQIGQVAEAEHKNLVVSRRLVAGIALAAVTVFVPMGAMLGPSWGSIQAAAIGGLPTTTPTATPTRTPFPTPPFPDTGQDYLATATAYPQHNPTISEHFDQRGSWSAGEFTDNTASGNRQVIDGIYRWEIKATRKTSQTTMLAVPALPIKFYLAVDAKKVGSEDASYGLFFRSTSDQLSYIVFRVNPTRQVFSVGTETQTYLLPQVTTAIHKEGYNQLAVVGDSTRYMVFVNGYLVGSFEVNSMMRGFFGIYAEISKENDEAVFEFDNFVLDY